MQVIQAFALGGAVSLGMLGALHVIVWRTQRERWSALFGSAFLLSALVYAFDPSLQPVEGRPNPTFTLLRAPTLALLTLGMIDYVGLRGGVARGLRALAVVSILILMGWVIAGAISRITIFAVYAAHFCTQAVLAAWAMRHEPRRGHGLVFLALLLFPATFLLALPGWVEVAMLRYVVIAPTVVLGMTVLTTGLLRAHRHADDERANAERAEASAHTANNLLEQRVDELERSEAALRSTEAQLRQMIDSNLVGIAFLDLSGRVIDANDAYLRIVGYDRHDLHEGRIHRATVTAPEYAGVTAQALAEARAVGACTPYEKEFVRKDGSRVPVLVGMALTEPGSERAVAFVLDRTASQQAQIERDARLEAELASRAKSEFLACMSHELRTPLNGILGFAQLLQRDKPLSERQARGLKVIHESGQHLLALINDVLDLARIDADKLELYPTEVHLPAFLQVVCDIVRVKADEKNLLFSYEPAHGLPEAVQVDEKRLRQILLNLLSNAIKFTDGGKVVLRVRSQRPDAATVRLHFEVQDSGVGMDEAQLARLFQPFEQVGEARRRQGGAGLGLAISQRLVRLMGGEIQVRSRPGEGSVFSVAISLPVVQAPVLAAPGSAAPVGYGGPRKKVLVVDDVAQNRLMLLDALGQVGFLVSGAGDGLESLDVAARARPDLILMDVMMPGMDGFEAMRRLRGMPEFAKLPIIAMSASASREVEARCRACGADAFVAKPIEHEALLLTMGRLLGLAWLHEPNGIALST